MRDYRLVFGVLGLMSVALPAVAQQVPEVPVASVGAPAASDSTAAQPAPAVTDPTPADPIARAIKEQIARASGDKADVAAAAAFYAARNHAPLWISDTGATPPARMVMMTLKSADAWGLKASDFTVPALDDAAPASAKAEFEIALTLAALKYAKHARGGRVTPTALTIFLDRKPPVLPAADVLGTQIGRAHV